MIPKTRAVLALAEDRPGPDVVFSNWADIIKDEGAVESGRTVSIRKEMWEEMGRPRVLTLTLETGDTLNPESVYASSSFSQRTLWP